MRPDLGSWTACQPGPSGLSSTHLLTKIESEVQLRRHTQRVSHLVWLEVICSRYVFFLLANLHFGDLRFRVPANPIGGRNTAIPPIKSGSEGNRVFQEAAFLMLDRGLSYNL